MTHLFPTLWFIIFIKLLFFWLWLWQLKEYHLGRFRAHFETQKFRKIASSIWRLKFPRFTKKIILISFTGILLEILLLFYLSVFGAIILTILLFPLFILSFQIPTVIWRKIIIERAQKKREKFSNLLVIGITGSYGKTSTKEFLFAILSERATLGVLKTKEHQNSEMGISRCVLNDLKPEHQIFIVEMGAYNKGGIKLLCEIVRPKIGILTGINEQHMSTFGSLENIIKTKYELIESLPEDGIAFFNAKNKHCQELYQKTLRRGSGRVHLYGEGAKFFGEENLLGAIAVAKELGMTDEEISRVCEKIENKIPGVQIKEGKNGLKIIDATYSANPDGVMAHLEYLKTLRQAQGKLIIVMPCLIELGKASKEIHKKIGKKMGRVCDLAIITTKDRFREIKEGAGEKVIFLDNPEEILEKIRSFVQRGDVVLLESRVPISLIDSLIK